MIQRFARCHLTPSRRESVARMVSPETRLSVSPSSKATSAAISRVHRLVAYPNSLGERWSISLKASALWWSKASRVRLGREEPGVRASRPLASKSWMAVAHGLPAASEVRSYSRDPISPRTRREKHLRTAQSERVFGAQPGFEAFALLLRKRTYKDWSFHGYYCNSQPETYPGDALGFP